MLRYLYKLGVVITAMFTACSNEVEEITDPTPKMVEIAVVADTEGDEVETRLDVVGNTTHWEVGDKISLYLIANYYSTATATLKLRLQ